MDGESASLQSGWPSRFGSILYGRLHAPAGWQIVDPGLHGMPTAVLIGASGKTYTANGTSRGTRGVDQPHEIDYRFPALAESPARVRIQLIEKSRPERLFSFRMTDIPLPPEPAFGTIPRGRTTGR